MDELELLVDLHRGAARQGPGGEAETKLALDLARVDRSRPLRIVDIGCGTGASTLLLAKELNAEITAVDFLQEFLDELRSRAHEQGVLDKIATVNCSMDALPFAEGEFDVIWSEGAIYNMGFEAGVSAWRRFLKPGGKLVVSEITWLTAARPPEIQAHWEREYPEVDVASAKLESLERHGYSPGAFFVLPRHCWTEAYYHPLLSRFEGFLDRHGQSEAARRIVAAEKDEIALYERYGAYYSYGVYVSGKVGE
ncbi:class I SAM-dependent methyltransferase [Desulfohalovibrio reitneri]|uniref:class I SAM-dependent methyltransferase n=1 Tax=Desulfohalovibrio reitneri TaxID=1307759 RepID=UPI0004A6F083|nr:class I SAM-dependent methyltransferase [Desulfohalovibrio reitneri]